MPEPQSRMPPKMIDNLRHIVAKSGDTVELPCSAQAHPWPTFTWYRASIEPMMSSSASSLSSSASSSSGSLSAVTTATTTTITKRLNRLLIPIFRIPTVSDFSSPSSGSSSSALLLLEDIMNLQDSSSSSSMNQHSRVHHHVPNSINSLQPQQQQQQESIATTYRINKAGRIVQVDSSLFIRDLSVSDSGVYVCVANNSAGQDRYEIELMVKGMLKL